MPFSFHHYLSFTSLSCHCICCSYALFSKVTIKVPHIPMIVILHVCSMTEVLIVIYSCHQLQAGTSFNQPSASMRKQISFHNLLMHYLFTYLHHFLDFCSTFNGNLKVSSSLSFTAPTSLPNCHLQVQ